jgi:hypothetical protein
VRDALYRWLTIEQDGKTTEWLKFNRQCLKIGEEILPLINDLPTSFGQFALTTSYLAV